jgi:predicted nucleotidyltransferase
MLVRHSEDGIRRVLHRLTEQGIVTSERVGQAFTYRLNRRHLAADAVIALARLGATLLDRIEQALEAWESPPVYGAVFGSAARGEMRPDSDIDLLLVRPDACDRERWDELVSGLTADINEWTGNDVQVLEFTESEVRQAGTAEPVLRDVRSHGLTVAGSSAWLTSALSRKDPTHGAD